MWKIFKKKKNKHFHRTPSMDYPHICTIEMYTFELDIISPTHLNLINRLHHFTSYHEISTHVSIYKTNTWNWWLQVFHHWHLPHFAFSIHWTLRLRDCRTTELNELVFVAPSIDDIRAVHGWTCVYPPVKASRIQHTLRRPEQSSMSVWMLMSVCMVMQIV